MAKDSDGKDKSKQIEGRLPRILSRCVAFILLDEIMVIRATIITVAKGIQIIFLPQKHVTMRFEIRPRLDESVGSRHSAIVLSSSHPRRLHIIFVQAYE